MKQWTAQDLRMDNELRITKGKNEEGKDALMLIRGYRFVDGSENNIPGLGKQRLTREVLWSDIPTNIKSAFAALHQWTRNEALKEQEME